MEDQKRIAFPSPKTTMISIGQQSVAVKNYLSQSEMESLTTIYLSELFKATVDPNRFNVFDAENALICSIIEFVTNIPIVTKDDKGNVVPAFTLDDLHANWQIVQEILNAIGNYQAFRSRLSRVVAEIEEERRLRVSLGAVIEGLAEKTSLVLDSLLKADATPEGIERIRGLLREVDASPVLSEALGHFKREEGKPTRKPRKKS